MISLEAIFALLDELRAEAIQAAETPNSRDAFGFGEVSAQLRIIAEFRGRLEAVISINNKHEDDIG